MFALSSASLRFTKLLSFKILRPFARSSLSLKEGSSKRAQENTAIKLKLARQEKIEEANEFSPQQNACQNYILTAKNQERLTDIYEHFRDEMNLVNLSTFLHRFSLFQAEANKDSNVSNKISHPESIDELISSLTKQLPLMKEQTVSIFLSDLLRLKRVTPEILLQVASQTLISNWKHSIAQISMILTALADENDLKKREIIKQQQEVPNKIQEEQNQQEEQQQPHQFVIFAKNRFLEIKGHIPADILAEAFLSFGRLGFKNEELTTYIEAQIYRSSQQFNLQNLQKVFECYERKYYPKNIEVLDALSGRFMDLGKHLKVKDISRILVSCSNLNYVNQILFEYIEKQLIRRIKSSIVAQNKDVSEDTGISLIEKYAQQSKSYSEEELELLRNLMGQSQQQQMDQQQQQVQESNPEEKANSGNNQQEVKNNEQLLKQQETQEKQINDIEPEELEDDFECEVLDVQTDAESILQFQKDFENQKNLIESNKNTNQQLIEKYKIKTHKYDQVQELNLQVASEILSAFCKLKVVKKELFELLETNFSVKIQAAKPSDIIIHAYAHSLLCKEMEHEYSLPQNSYLKRSLKNIRKFNQNFFEIVLPEVESKIDQFSIQDIQTILLSAGTNDIKKRAINRRLHSLAIESIDKLFEINDLSPEARAQLIYQHYYLAMPFAITQELQKEFIGKLEERKIPLQLLINRYAHLVPRPHLPNIISTKSEKLGLLEQSPIVSNQVTEESKQ